MIKKRLISLIGLLIVLVIGVFIGKILYDKPVKTLSITTYGEDCGQIFVIFKRSLIIML